MPATMLDETQPESEERKEKKWKRVVSSASSAQREQMMQQCAQQMAQLQSATDALVKLAAVLGQKTPSPVPEEVVPVVAVPTVGVAIKAPIDRDRLLSDLTNTGVMAALVGGFALTNTENGIYDSQGEHTGAIDYVTYVAAYSAVHACTCSALTSALLYREANMLEDDAVIAWANERKILLMLPMMKFGMGVMAYLSCVIIVAWRDLATSPVSQIITLVVGVMSMSMVFMTVAKVGVDNLKEAKKKAMVNMDDMVSSGMSFLPGMSPGKRTSSK